LAQLYKVKQNTAVSLAQFALSAKVTELAADYEDPDISAFALPLTEVWAQSEELVIAEQPLDFPLYGAIVDLETLRPDLLGVQAIALTGRRQKLRVKTGLKHEPEFTPDDGTSNLKLHPGDGVTLLEPKPL